jgi:hypothetical protein
MGVKEILERMITDTGMGDSRYCDNPWEAFPSTTENNEMNKNYFVLLKEEK